MRQFLCHSKALMPVNKCIISHQCARNIWKTASNYRYHIYILAHSNKYTIFEMHFRIFLCISPTKRAFILLIFFFVLAFDVCDHRDIVAFFIESLRSLGHFIVRCVSLLDHNTNSTIWDYGIMSTWAHGGGMPLERFIGRFNTKNKIDNDAHGRMYNKHGANESKMNEKPCG